MRVKLVGVCGELHYGYGDYGELEGVLGLFANDFKSMELNQDEYNELVDAVNYFNRNQKKTENRIIVLIDKLDDMQQFDEILKDYKSYVEKEEKRRLKAQQEYEERERLKNEAKAAKALERKRKQLEKLKQEFGEE